MFRRRSLAFSVALVALGVSTGACVSTNEVGGSDEATPTTTTVPPTIGSFGTDVVYGDVVATVVDAMPFDQSPNGVPRLKIVMRAENLAGSVRRNPDVELQCAESPHLGDWFLGSTWEPNVVLPVNAVTQGEVIVGFPMKDDNPEYAVVTCTSPRIRLSMVAPTRVEDDAAAADDVDSEAVGPEPTYVVDIPVDDSVIAEAIRRPRGPKLPLPPRGS